MGRVESQARAPAVHKFVVTDAVVPGYSPITRLTGTARRVQSNTNSTAEGGCATKAMVALESSGADSSVSRELHKQQTNPEGFGFGNGVKRDGGWDRVRTSGHENGHWPISPLLCVAKKR